MMTELLIILSAIPLGYLLAWLSREELVPGRAWFRRLMVVSLVIGGMLLLYGQPEGLTMGVFLAILAFIAYIQSFKASWTKKQK